MKDPSPIAGEVRQRAAETSRRHGDDAWRYFDRLKADREAHRAKVVEQITAVSAKPIRRLPE